MAKTTPGGGEERPLLHVLLDYIICQRRNPPLERCIASHWPLGPSHSKEEVASWYPSLLPFEIDQLLGQAGELLDRLEVEVPPLLQPAEEPDWETKCDQLLSQNREAIVPHILLALNGTVNCSPTALTKRLLVVVHHHIEVAYALIDRIGCCEIDPLPPSPALEAFRHRIEENRQELTLLYNLNDEELFGPLSKQLRAQLSMLLPSDGNSAAAYWLWVDRAVKSQVGRAEERLATVLFDHRRLTALSRACPKESAHALTGVMRLLLRVAQSTWPHTLFGVWQQVWISCGQLPNLEEQQVREIALSHAQIAESSHTFGWQRLAIGQLVNWPLLPQRDRCAHLQTMHRTMVARISDEELLEWTAEIAPDLSPELATSLHSWNVHHFFNKGELNRAAQEIKERPDLVEKIIGDLLSLHLNDGSKTISNIGKLLRLVDPPTLSLNLSSRLASAIQTLRAVQSRAIDPIELQEALDYWTTCISYVDRQEVVPWCKAWVLLMIGKQPAQRLDWIARAIVTANLSSSEAMPLAPLFGQVYQATALLTPTDEGRAIARSVVEAIPVDETDSLRMSKDLSLLLLYRRASFIATGDCSDIEHALTLCVEAKNGTKQLADLLLTLFSFPHAKRWAIDHLLNLKIGSEKLYKALLYVAREVPTRHLSAFLDLLYASHHIMDSLLLQVIHNQLILTMQGSPEGISEIVGQVQSLQLEVTEPVGQTTVRELNRIATGQSEVLREAPITGIGLARLFHNGASGLIHSYRRGDSPGGEPGLDEWVGMDLLLVPLREQPQVARARHAISGALALIHLVIERDVERAFTALHTLVPPDADPMLRADLYEAFLYQLGSNPQWCSWVPKLLEEMARATCFQAAPMDYAITLGRVAIDPKTTLESRETINTAIAAIGRITQGENR